MATKDCPGCEKQLCKKCMSRHEACPICGVQMPLGALRCNTCQIYRHWWRNLLAIGPVAGALIGAILALLPQAFRAGSDYFNRHSDTTVTFLTATGEHLTIGATNTGRRASVIRGAELRFDPQVGIPATILQLYRNPSGEPDSIVVEPGKTIRVRFIGTGYATKQLRAEVEKLLRQQDRKVSLAVDVQESDSPKQTSRRAPSVETYPAFWFADFVIMKIPRERL